MSGKVGSDPIYSPAHPTVVERAWEVLVTVADPEIPVISVLDLGIVRDVVECDGGVEVRVTPTYAGCPATEMIAHDIRTALERHDIAARVVTVLAPAWSTDWITQAGRAKLRKFGITPPGAVDRRDGQVVHLIPRGTSLQQSPACPHCGSAQTERLSQFGSTPCKALYRCMDCREPFDYFKPL